MSTGTKPRSELRFFKGSKVSSNESGYSNRDDVSVILEAEDCCICLTPTVERTACRHPLCTRCARKLRKPSCPICRRDVEIPGALPEEARKCARSLLSRISACTSVLDLMRVVDVVSPVIGGLLIPERRTLRRTLSRRCSELVKESTPEMLVRAMPAFQALDDAGLLEAEEIQDAAFAITTQALGSYVSHASASSRPMSARAARPTSARRTSLDPYAQLQHWECCTELLVQLSASCLLAADVVDELLITLTLMLRRCLRSLKVRDLANPMIHAVLNKACTWLRRGVDDGVLSANATAIVEDELKQALNAPGTNSVDVAYARTALVSASLLQDDPSTKSEQARIGGEIRVSEIQDAAFAMSTQALGSYVSHASASSRPMSARAVTSRNRPEQARFSASDRLAGASQHRLKWNRPNHETGVSVAPPSSSQARRGSANEYAPAALSSRRSNRPTSAPPGRTPMRVGTATSVSSSSSMVAHSQDRRASGAAGHETMPSTRRDKEKQASLDGIVSF